MADSACDCISRVNKTLAHRGLNSPVKQVIRFDVDGKPSDSNAIVQTEVDVPKRGARSATLFATFCPFCGGRYEAAPAVSASEAV